MIEIILAGALGAIALIVCVLFRQLRELSWQLTQLRVERDSERILHDIGIRAGSANTVAALPTVPARRKKHLSLFLGGAAAASAWLRNHRSAFVGTGAAATAAMAAAALYLATSDDLAPRDGPQVTIPGATGTSTPVSPAPEPQPSSSAVAPAGPLPTGSPPTQGREPEGAGGEA
ncbi:hypothetical protein KMT30_06720, partial [Streptomyces sp. IBSBF 2953]|nr:hypothetical protein [Streptomyces hayashii]